jgi:hypothetical protein
MKTLAAIAIFAAALIATPAAAQSERDDLIMILATISSSDTVCGHPIDRTVLEFAITEFKPENDETFVLEIIELDTLILEESPGWPQSQRDEFCGNALVFAQETEMLRQ